MYVVGVQVCLPTHTGRLSIPALLVYCYDYHHGIATLLHRLLLCLYDRYVVSDNCFGISDNGFSASMSAMMSLTLLRRL